MTNEQIIFEARCELMREGKIGKSGNVYKAVDADGNERIYEEPEEIHTYQAWKEQGYQVQKGQKAVARIVIWKYAVSKAKDGEEDGKEHMFMKNSAFFTRAQVEPIKAGA